MTHKYRGCIVVLSINKSVDMGWPDLLSEPMVELMDDVDNSRMLLNSPAVPLLPMQQLFNPMDIRNISRWCNVAADHKAVLQSTNSQWNNRLHSNFGSKNPPDRNKVER